MAQDVITAGDSHGAGSLVRDHVFVCETRATWIGTWTPVDYLRPVMGTDAIAGSVGSALIEYQYGEIARAGVGSKSHYDSLPITDKFIRIVDSETGFTWWTGFIDGETLEPFGGSGGAGSQKFTAWGLCHLLDRSPVDFCQARDKNGNTITIDNVPEINGVNGHAIGNRSSTRNADGVYEFSAEGEDWNDLDWLEAALLLYPPADGPAFSIGGQYSFLAGMKSKRRKIYGRTAWSVITEILDRRRGVGFFPLLTYDQVVLYVFPILDAPITISGVTIPANTLTASLNLDTRVEIDECRITKSSSTQVDELIVHGNPILACFSVAAADGTLEHDFSAGDEANYKDGGKDTAGYASLTDKEQASLNDAIRGSEQLEKVYSRLRVPESWDGQAGDGEGGTKTAVLPACASNGAVTFNSANAFTSLGKKFETFVPIVEGADMNAGAPDITPTTEFRAPFAIVMDAVGTYHLVHRPSGALKESGGAAHVKVFKNGMSVGVQAHPPHIYGLGHYDPATAEPSDREPVVDIDDVICTIAMRMDSRIRYVAQRTGATQILTRKHIFLDGVEFWWIAAGTVLDVASDNTLVRMASALIVRDDRQDLYDEAARGMAWYSKERRALTMSTRDMWRIQPGTLIESVVTARGVLAANTILSSIKWDFVNRTTTIETAWTETDWRD